MLSALVELVDLSQHRGLGASGIGLLLLGGTDGARQDPAPNTRDCDASLLYPTSPRLRSVSDRLLGSQLRIAPVVDPTKVDTVHLSSGDNGEVEGEVREAPSGLQISLNDMLKAFDDRRAAELHVPLYDRTSLTMNCDAPEGQERRGQETFFAARPGVEASGLQEEAVALGRPWKSDGPGFVVTEVPNVSVVEVELVVPRVGIVTGLPRTRSDSDERSSATVRSDNFGRRVDTCFEHHHRPSEVAGAHQPVVVQESVVLDVHLVRLAGIAKLVMDEHMARTRISGGQRPHEVDPYPIHLSCLSRRPAGIKLPTICARRRQTPRLLHRYA